MKLNVIQRIELAGLLSHKIYNHHTINGAVRLVKLRAKWKHITCFWAKMYRKESDYDENDDRSNRVEVSIK